MPKVAVKKVPAGARQAKLARAITVKAKENPRRAGTAAHKFHEAMVKSKTVGDYLGRFKDKKVRRDANLWLATSVRDGHVKLARAA